MRVVASTVLILATTSTLAADAPPGDPRRGYSSEDAIRHYALGRLLEERGQGPEALREFFRALLMDSRGAGIARRISELSAQLGDAERSLEFAERALVLAPGDPRSLWLKGSALFNLGKLQESLGALESAALADSDQVEYLRTLARVAEHLDRIDLVERAYGRAVVLEEDDGESWFQLAAARARRRDFHAADRALSRAMDLNPVRPGLFFLAGLIKEGVGEPQRAIDLYRRHLAIHADDQVTRRRLVNVLARERRHAEAYREARAMSRARPGDYEALEVETELAFRAGRSAEAARLLDRLIRMSKDDPEVLARVIGLMARNGRARSAIALADGWEARHPRDHRGPLLAARARAWAGQGGSAIRSARRAVEMAPDSLAPRIVLGRLYQEERRYRDAARVWSDAIRRFPDHTGVGLDLAYCRERLGDVAGAQTMAREVLTRDPDNPVALNFLGYLLADHGQSLGEAEDLIRRAVDQEPDNGAFVDSLGWVYYRLGRLAEARRHLERALALTGGDPVVHEHLGDLYKDLHLLDLAREHYRRSLAGDRSNARVRAKLDEIR